MKRIALALLIVFSGLLLGGAYNPHSSGKGLSKDLIDRRDGRGPSVTEIAGDLWTQGKMEYSFGKESRQPVDASFYVPGNDASSR